MNFAIKRKEQIMNSRLLQIVSLASIFGGLDNFGIKTCELEATADKRQTKFETIFGNGKKSFTLLAKKVV